MSLEEAGISIPQHTAHLAGYMDAVGRVLTSDTELVSLSAQLVMSTENLDVIVGKVQGRDEVKNMVAEFSRFVTNFLELNERERLGFYLIDLLLDYRDFFESCVCYKLECERCSAKTRAQAAYLLEFKDGHRVVLVALRSDKAHDPPLDQPL